MESRIETLLNAVVNGDSIEGFAPQSRAEEYLLAAVNKSGIENLPKPQSRLDALLYKLADMMPESYGADFEAGYNKGYSDAAIKRKTFANGETILLEDNVIYRASEPIDTLIIEYPEGEFLCNISFTLADTGVITITLPESQYIGDVPIFVNGVTWELSIQNGVVIGGMVE